MKKLTIDSRGYPIPWIVQIGNTGEPHFIINDFIRVDKCRKGDLCGICGQSLMRGRWFIGGPLSAFHPNGAYIDPPMHKECMEYAMQVCPYISMSNYNAFKMHELRKNIKTPKDLGGVVLVDETMIPGRPAIFVCVHARASRALNSGHFCPAKPYIGVQYWRHGQQITKGDTIEYLLDINEIETAYFISHYR
jgi:hypothetical protein